MPELTINGLRILDLPLLEFSVGAGELVTLSGPSGCGKSLLLRAIADLDSGQGEVMLGDRSREQMPAPDWRRLVGLLPAESHWWFSTAAEHLPKSDGKPLAEVELDALGLSSESLGWQISRLSSGERQRLALLRLLAWAPHALLLDEPTANLDPANGLRVEALIRSYAESRQAAVLWVSHDSGQCKRIADRQMQMGGEGVWN